MRIYLDNAASTRPDRRAAALAARLEREAYANDAALHAPGLAAALRTESARAAVAGRLGAAPEEIVFTSGGTEANNLALLGAWAARPKGKNHLLISAFEHPSVALAAAGLKKAGAAVTALRPGAGGAIDPESFARALRPDTFLASVMLASNETGALQPAAALAAACRRRGTLFHTDACQAFAKAPAEGRAWGADLASVSAHKIHGPKGAGALFVRKGLRLAPPFSGGGHEGGLRPGTRNTPALAAFGLAAGLWTPAHTARIAGLRDLLWRELSAALPGAVENCAGAPRVCGILSVTLPGIASAAALLRRLSAAGVYASAGSACAAGETGPSSALLAFGLSRNEALRSIRLSLGRFTSRAEVLAAAGIIAQAVKAETGGRRARR